MTKAYVQTQEAETALREWGDHMREQAAEKHQLAADYEQKAQASKDEGDKLLALHAQAQEALANLAAHKAGKKAK